MPTIISAKWDGCLIQARSYRDEHFFCNSEASDDGSSTESISGAEETIGGGDRRVGNPSRRGIELYLKQLAQETVMSVLGSRELCNQVKVLR